MKGCPECQTQLPDAANFCWNCGLELRSVRVAPAPGAAATGGVDFSHFPTPPPLSKRDKRVRYGGTINERLRRLGVVQGRTYREIVEVLGEPDALTAMGDGTRLAQWIRTSGWTGSAAHYSLIFDESGICGGITHQFRG